MAQNTAINFTLNARDWEWVMGIIDNSSENSLRSLKSKIQAYYAANANPQGTTPVTITTREGALVSIFQKFYGNTIRNVCSDTGGSPFNRVIAAIRAANNATDNYISTALAAEDAAINANQVAIRKNGREVLMMESFDNA